MAAGDQLPIDDDVRAELENLPIDDDVRAELEGLTAPPPTNLSGNADLLGPSKQLDDPATPSSPDSPEEEPVQRIRPTRLATAKAGPIAGMGPTDMGRTQQGEPLSPEARRILLEIGLPTAVGFALGPEAGIGVRALASMAAGGGASGVGELISPSPDARTAATRIGLNMIPVAEGLDLLPQIPRAIAKGALTTGGAAALATGGDPTMTEFGMVPGGLLGAAGAMARGAPLQRFSENQVAKALGFIFSTLRGTGRDEARRVARVAMDEGVVGRMSGPEAMLGRAQATQDRAGARLGQIRGAADAADPGASRSELARRIEGDLRDWTPGETDEPVFQRQLDSALNDVDQSARAGAVTAPVRGPEGDRQLWEMTRDEARAWASQRPRPTDGWSPDPTLGPLLQQHRAEVASALVHGHQVPERVLAEYPDLVRDLPPEYMNASTLGRFKSIAARHAYNEAKSLTPETLQGSTAQRWEVARANAQQSEEELIRRVLSQQESDDFLRQKDVYGAMERLTNPLSGATEARASRVLGNNQMFGMTPQLAGVMGAAMGGGPARGGPLAAILGLLAKGAYEFGNQNVGLLARDANRMLLSPELALALSVSPNLVRGLGMSRPADDEGQGTD